MKIAVLGAGMVGRAIASDLSGQYTVNCFDINSENLQTLKKRNPSVQVEVKDLRRFEDYPAWLKPFDAVVTAVPGFMGYKCLEAVINSGKNCADISFFPEDVLQLQHLAKEKNVTIITDVGVAPGMSNLILGYHDARMKVNNFECYVGGLPAHPQPPFFYKAPFSPIDVIEEYTRPARMQVAGKIVTFEALTDRELLHFDGVGTLEAFNTDGLRSLLFTMPHIRDMKEKTLRYPGHIDLIIALKQAGFFSEEKIEINGSSITPLEYCSKILINNWKLNPGEEELTIMKVRLSGTDKDKPVCIEYDLLDKYDRESETSSMARSTGYTCAAAMNLILKEIFTEKGLFPPELLGKNEAAVQFIFDYLKQRKVIWKKSVKYPTA